MLREKLKEIYDQTIKVEKWMAEDLPSTSMGYLASSLEENRKDIAQEFLDS
ncbi:hypothetical protein KGY64_05670 [Candidatus Bipolaricaulota bacterium]|nr:hypothetical protein [Candidatus Bipolaricaulota bacterium]